MRVGEAVEVVLNLGALDVWVAPRDVVLLDEGDRPKLRRSDMLIVRRLGLADALAAAEAPGRDPRYASPEELARVAVTEGSLVYRFGILLYELLGGSPPFDGTTPAEVRDQQLRSIADATPGSASGAPDVRRPARRPDAGSGPRRETSRPDLDPERALGRGLPSPGDGAGRRGVLTRRPAESIDRTPLGTTPRDSGPVGPQPRRSPRGLALPGERATHADGRSVSGPLARQRVHADGGRGPGPGPGTSVTEPCHHRG